MNLNEIFLAPHHLKQIEHGQKIIQLGSCFSTHISEKLKQSGFQVCDNPFGVVFHPSAIAQQITDSIANKQTTRKLLRDDIWLSYDASSSIYSLSELELEEAIQSKRIGLNEAFETAHLLIVTFGSSRGYLLKDTQEIVANCHQQNASNFKHELTSLHQLESEWKSILNVLKQNYPQLQIVFTVSPVRYSKEGWIENNRSKARLIELCNLLEKEGAIYFPSYEIIIDLLRDYRYFEKDGVHPNELAIDEVWNLFQHWFFGTETQLLIKEIGQLRAMESHKILFPESKSAKAFKEQFQNKKKNLLETNPLLVW